MKNRALAAAAVALLSLSACSSAAPIAVPPAVAPASPNAALSSASPGAAPSPPAAPSASPVPAQGSEAAANPAQAPGPAVAPTPSSMRIGPLQYIRQTLNNCGPASIAEVLRYWGVARTQEQVQAAVRPDLNSRGMWPYGVPTYVSSTGMSSLMGVGGNPRIVKALVANGFPVIVAQMVSLTEREAHYREIEGFDDQRQTFVSTDTYLGPNHEIGYAEFDQLWERGNQRFMVIYPPAKESLLNAVLASVGWNKKAAYQADLVKQLNPQNRPPDYGPPNVQFRGSSSLFKAWDHIQLGELDTARAEIQEAVQTGANPLMVGWLNQALQSASK